MFWFFFLFSGLCAGIPLLTKPLFYKYCKLRHLTLYRKKKLSTLLTPSCGNGERNANGMNRKKKAAKALYCMLPMIPKHLLREQIKVNPLSLQCANSILFSIHFLVLKPPSKCIMVFFYKARSVVALQCNLCNKSRSFKWQKIKTTDI